MPTQLDIDLLPVVEELLAEFGRDVLVRMDQGEYDPVTNEQAHDWVDVPTQGFPESASLRGMVARLYMGSAENPVPIQAGDIFMMVPGKPFEDLGGTDDEFYPELNDVLHYTHSEDGKFFSIKGAEAVFTGEQVALFILHIRGS